MTGGGVGDRGGAAENTTCSARQVRVAWRRHGEAVEMAGVFDVEPVAA